MFTQYLDCTIEIQPRNGDSYSFSIHAPGGDARDTFQLPNNDQQFQASIAKLSKLTAREDDLTYIGQKLFESLFQGKGKEIYARSQGVLQHDQGLRIVLRGADDPAFAALPWEFLYDPDQGPLVMLDAPIVRYLPQSAVLPTLKTSLPLKVLLTSAQPKDQAPIQVEKELKEVQTALEDLAQQGLVQLTVEP
ncbi:MAG TPA: CHAT domain-containing protein, partial [Roseiflexaceae bacterium]|nr:CHAT domain-containing protein [Roseiflexaceae bacterium]